VGCIIYRSLQGVWWIWMFQKHVMGLLNLSSFHPHMSPIIIIKI
jgi:hypothetical protein